MVRLLTIHGCTGSRPVYKRRRDSPRLRMVMSGLMAVVKLLAGKLGGARCALIWFFIGICA